MYLYLQDGEERFVWDESRKIMYQVVGDTAKIIQPDLMKLSKFRPDLALIKKTEKKPDIDGIK